MKKILVTGHLGYVGAALLPALRTAYQSAEIIGLDTGFFESDLWGQDKPPESLLTRNVNSDIRAVDASLLTEVDAIIHLASISNDPIGQQFSAATKVINEEATLSLAKMAQHAGVKRFIFASSCSIYGATDNELVDETATQRPLTEYARSKVASEAALQKMASTNFQVTNLRFGTACGYSSRLRLDLVVNDFVATAIAKNKIELLSSGTAWRPFVHVNDMSKALCWAVQRPGPNSVTVNIGSDDMCLSIAQLAEKVASHFPGSELIIPAGDVADNRSYKVSFAKFRAIAPDHQPSWCFDKTIEDLKARLEAASFNDKLFRQGPAMRLNKLKDLLHKGMLDSNLRWTHQ